MCSCRPLGWIPASNSSVTPCAGLDAINAPRPPEQNWFVALNAALVAIFVTTSVLFLSLWWVLRKEPALRSRPFVLQCAMTVGVFLAYVVVCLKRALVDPSGHPNMSCELFVWLYISVVPVVAGTNVRFY